MTDHLPHGLLIDYLHRELPPGDDALVFAHLSACPECSAELEAESALSDLLRSAAARETLDFPTAMIANVRQAARSTPRTFAWPAFRFAYAIPLAAAAVAGLFLVPTFRQNAAPRIDANYYLLQHATGHVGVLGDHAGHSTFLIEESNAGPVQGSMAALIGAAAPNGPFDGR